MASSGFGSVPSTSPSPALVGQKLRAEQLVKNGAGWFLAIAGLSIRQLGPHHEWDTFLVQLWPRHHPNCGCDRTPERRDRLHSRVDCELFIAGVFVLFWSLARKGERWAFLVGMALYAIDGLILLPFKDYLSAAFHAYALFRIYGGVQGIPVLQQLQQALVPAGAPIEPRWWQFPGAQSLFRASLIETLLTILFS